MTEEKSWLRCVRSLLNGNLTEVFVVFVYVDHNAVAVEGMEVGVGGTDKG